LPTDLVSLISSVGFPIAVAIYLLLVMNKTLKELTGAINNNTQAIVKLYEQKSK
jgi:hypothetical protein